jgi:hypothetical protein
MFPQIIGRGPPVVLEKKNLNLSVCMFNIKVTLTLPMETVHSSTFISVNAKYIPGALTNFVYA